MSRILLVGVGPLPAGDLRRVYAPGLRLEAFLDALLRAGCDVHLGEIHFAGIDDEFRPAKRDGLVAHELLGPGLDAIIAGIDAIAEKSPPDAIVALTDIGCLAASRSKFGGPLHADFFGHPMAERQQQAYIHRSDASLHAQWLDVLPTLLRADRFSACSPSQRLALVGELGAAGRLNSQTCNLELVEVVPPTLPFSEPIVAKHPNYLETKGIPSGARVVFSSGGYNTWLDEETMFRGIEDALQRDTALHFVSTGGAIEGHVEVVYTRFRERVAASPVADRFHLLGWVPHAELLDAMLGAHVGINVDRQTLEGELGCRNRILGWLWTGMRVVSTVSSDATADLVRDGWVNPVTDGDWETLSAALREEAHRLPEADPATRRAALRAAWGPENHFRALAQWARNPTSATDRPPCGIVDNPLANLHRAFLAHAASSADTDAIRQRARAIAARLSGSRALALYAKLHPETAALIDELNRL